MYAVVYESDLSMALAYIESFQSAELTRRYRAHNTFHMIMDAQYYRNALVSKGRFIGVLEQPDMKIPARLYRIQHLQLDTVAQTLEVRAVEVSEFFNVRPVIPPSGQTHMVQNNINAEVAMLYYVNQVAGPGAPDTGDRIPRLALAVSQGRGTNVSIQARYQSLTDVLQQIGYETGLGWDVVYDSLNNQHMFSILQGLDVSDQVIFSTDFDSINNIRYTNSDADRYTRVIAAGQGEGTARTVVLYSLPGPVPTGFDRRTEFLDASDVPTAQGLTDRANGELQKYTVAEAVSVDVNGEGSFKYRTHYDLGYIVTVSDTSYAISKKMRIEEITLSWTSDSALMDVALVLDKAAPTFFDLVSRTQSFSGKSRN